MNDVSRKTLFRSVLALAVLSLAAMGAIDTGLKGPAAPMGIISFQFCGLGGTCDALLAQWGDHGRLLGMLSLGIDYLFLVTYPLLVMFGLQSLATRVPERLRAPTSFFAWFVLIAGIADALENYVLIRILLGQSDLGIAPVASAFAILKFSVFYTSLAWLVFAGSKRLAAPRD